MEGLFAMCGVYQLESMVLRGQIASLTLGWVDCSLQTVAVWPIRLTGPPRLLKPWVFGSFLLRYRTRQWLADSAVSASVVQILLPEDASQTGADSSIDPAGSQHVILKFCIQMVVCQLLYFPKYQG